MMELLYLFTLALFTAYTSLAQTWVPLGSNIPQTDNQGNTMCVDTINNVLIIGGDFGEVNGTPYNHIVQWDGSSFSDLSHSGPNGDVEDIAFYDSCVWVIGLFSNAGSGGGSISTPNNWARHTPSGWDLPVPFTLGGPGSVETHDSLVYLMGVFNNPGEKLIGLNENEVMEYAPFTGGFNSGGVITIYNYQGEKYIGGGFTQMLGTPTPITSSQLQITMLIR